MEYSGVSNGADGMDFEAPQRAGFRTRLAQRARAALTPIAFLAVCAFFVWHAVHGDRGLQAREARQQHLAAAVAERDRVQAELAAMERRVQGLRGDRLDRDQLDERARTLLNMVAPHEVVIPYGPERRLF